MMLLAFWSLAPPRCFYTTTTVAAPARGLIFGLGISSALWAAIALLMALIEAECC
jgi:hypothetical protein